MDLNRLRYFLVVCDTGTIRRAAELVHITPTALSKAIKVLEREVGSQLVEPRGRGIAITDDGQRLARLARPLLDEIATIPDVINARTASDRPVRIGSHEVFGTYFTRVLLDHLPDGTHLEHRYLTPGSIEQALVEHACDIGISYLPQPTPGTQSREVTRAGMGLFGLRRLRRRAFEQLEFAAPVQPVVATPTRTQGLDGWPDDRIPRRVTYRITNTESALELCRQGRAVAYFPRFVIDLHNEVSTPEVRLVHIASPLDDEPAHEQAVHVVTRVGDRAPLGLDGVESALSTLS